MLPAECSASTSQTASCSCRSDLARHLILPDKLLFLTARFCFTGTQSLCSSLISVLHLRRRGKSGVTTSESETKSLSVHPFTSHVSSFCSFTSSRIYLFCFPWGYTAWHGFSVKLRLLMNILQYLSVCRRPCEHHMHVC